MYLNVTDITIDTAELINGSRVSPYLVLIYYEFVNLQ